MNPTTPPTPPKCFCGSPMRLKVTSKFRKADGSPREFYGCSRWPDCEGTMSLHDDGSIMSLPADEATKTLRHEAHLVFDKVWHNGILNRRDAYRKLQQVMNLQEAEAHIGFFDAEQCRKVIEYFKQIDTVEYRRAGRHVQHHSRGRNRDYRRAKLDRGRRDADEREEAA